MKRNNITSLGFTLVESLIAMAVVGVLGAITVVAVSEVRENAHRTAEVASARQLVAAYLLYPQDNGGQLMPAVPNERELALNPVKDHQGNNVQQGAVAARYPYRLLPYLEDIRVLYPGQFEQHYHDLVGKGGAQYKLSLNPAFGLNTEYLGGDYQNPRTSPESGYYPNLAATNLMQVMNPSEQIAFVSATYGKDANTSAPFIGFHRVEAPNGVRTTWSRYSEDYPAQMGYVHLRHANTALVAHLDGSVAFLNEDELKDMRRWSNEARRQNDPDYRPSRAR